MATKDNKNIQRDKFFLTINSPLTYGYTHQEIFKIAFWEFPSFRYAAVVDEKGSNFHSHVFLIFNSRVRWSTVQKHFPHAHIDVVKGTVEEVLEYMKKEGKWLNDEHKQEQKIEGSFEEQGELPEKRKEKNTLLSELYAMILEGKTNSEIINENKVENMLHATELTTADSKGAVIWSLGIKLIIDNALYISAGYENSLDYLKEKWGLHTKDVLNLIVFNDTCVEFNSDLNCYTLKPEYRGFNYRQLRELLLVPKEDLKFYSPDMSIRKIRRIKNITLNYSKFDLSDLPDTDDIDNVILSQYLEPRLKAIVGTEGNLRDNVLLYYEKEIHFALNEHIRKNPKYYRGYLNLGYALLQINDHVLYDQTTDILAYSVEQFKMNMSFARGCIDFCRECGRRYKGELHPVLKEECPDDAVLEWVSKLNDLM